MSLWKQAAQCVNPLSLSVSAPLRLMVSLSPAPSRGWEAGDSSDSPVLARCLGQDGGTSSPKALRFWCGPDRGCRIDVLGFGEQWQGCGGYMSHQGDGCRAGAGTMLLWVSDSADRHQLPPGLSRDGAFPKNSAWPPCCPPLPGTAGFPCARADPGGAAPLEVPGWGGCGGSSSQGSFAATQHFYSQAVLVIPQILQVCAGPIP